jgi:hypothetical protein
MHRERSVRTLPPASSGPVLGPRLGISRFPRKAELNVVARQLANHSGQVGGKLVEVGALGLPGAVAPFSVRVDVRYDPPRVLGQERIVGRQPAEKAGQAAQEARADGLIRVTAGEKAQALSPAPELERANRPTLAGPADLFALRAPRGRRAEDGLRLRQPRSQEQVVTKVVMLASPSVAASRAF